MRNWLVYALACSLVAVAGQASMIEDETTQIHPSLVYQEDAHVAGDAPGTCAEADERRLLDADEDAHGLLVDYDDLSDAYVAKFAPEAVGQRVQLEVVLGDIRVTGMEFSVDVLNSDCSYSVFDPAAPPYQAPADDDDESPQAGEGQQLVTMTEFGDHACNEDEWKVHLKAQDGGVPGEVYMEWTDGSSATVAIDHSSQGTVGMYLHHDNTDVTLAKIEAILPADWDGRLKLAHGPCEAEEGELPETPEVGVNHGLNAEWTALDESYVIVVSISKGLEEVAQENADTAIGLATNPPTSVPVQCHHICSAVSGDLAYLLKLDSMTQ